MGYIIYRGCGNPVPQSRLRLIGAYLFAANAPDLDFLPGLLVGDLAKFHHGPSHSIGFAFLFGLLACLFFSRRLYPFVIAFSLYLSHVSLDYLVEDPSSPFGVPLFWPFSQKYFMAPFAFFRPFHYRAVSAESSMAVLLTFHNFLTVLAEVAFLLPLLAWVLLRQKSSQA
jgi:inner membrane protein